MKRSEYQDKYKDIDWEISKVNQYAVDLHLQEFTFRIPIRKNTFIGDVAYLPRDKDFNKKRKVNLILRFDSGYLPVKTPSASIEKAGDRQVIISYVGESNS